MGPCQGKWQLGSITPITLPTTTTTGTATFPSAQLGGVPLWHDDRPGAVGRCRVDLPIDAPLPDDLDERGWTVIDRFRDRHRWVDVVVLEGDTLPMHVAGEYMTEWRSFDALREAVARALAAAICPPVPENEPWQTILGGTTTGMWTGTTTTSLGNTQYLVPQPLGLSFE